jgi:hypothetical protein
MEKHAIYAIKAFLCYLAAGKSVIAVNVECPRAVLAVLNSYLCLKNA